MVELPEDRPWGREGRTIGRARCEIRTRLDRIPAAHPERLERRPVAAIGEDHAQASGAALGGFHLEDGGPLRSPQRYRSLPARQLCGHMQEWQRNKWN